MIYKLIFLLIIVSIAGLFTTAHFSSPPKNLGINGGNLSSCPDSPNCVSSQASDEKHMVQPFKADGPTVQVMANRKACIKKMDGNIIASNGPYLHAEFRSKWFRFVDDLECVYDEAEGKIDIRSAARLGYSDFGVNRKRVEKLRRLFAEYKI